MLLPRTKFQELLKKLFQFDCAELDFGIYRIMNQKRAIIEQFIDKELLEGVALELSGSALAQESSMAQQLVEVAAKIKENFGADALDAEGVLAEQYQKTPLGKQYLELRQQAATAQSRPQQEAAIFNHLYTFFSRYYDEGDFMSLRRYSRATSTPFLTTAKRFTCIGPTATSTTSRPARTLPTTATGMAAGRFASSCVMPMWSAIMSRVPIATLFRKRRMLA